MPTEYLHLLGVAVFVKAKRTICDTPSESNTSTEVEKVPGGGPAVAAASRFKSTETLEVAFGAASDPTGTVIGPMGTFVSRTPLDRVQPCTTSLVGVTRFPVEFT